MYAVGFNQVEQSQGGEYGANSELCQIKTLFGVYELLSTRGKERDSTVGPSTPHPEENSLAT